MFKLLIRLLFFPFFMVLGILWFFTGGLSKAKDDTFTVWRW